MKSVGFETCTTTTAPYSEFTKSQSTLLNGFQLKRVHFNLIDSTQTHCKELLQDSNKSLFKLYFDDEEYSKQTFYLISATDQTNSYGRENRTWHSMNGNFLGTYMIYWPDRLLAKLPYTSQTVALAISTTIEQYHLPTEIKWTNDVLIHRKKVAGILCDAIPLKGEEGSMLLIGIGLNVNMEKELAIEKFQATKDMMKTEFTSMQIESNQLFNLEEITTLLTKNLLEKLIILQSERFSVTLLSEVEARLAYRGEKVIYSDGNETIENVTLSGITEDGFARLSDEKGEEQIKLTGRIRPMEQ